MAGAIQYFEHRDISIDAVTTDQDVAAGGEYEIELINQSFGSGSQDGNPFAVFYEGAIQVDSTVGGNYNFTLSTRHTFADGSTYDSPDRMLTFRIARNSEYSIPISNFNSISTIPTGTYTDAQLDGDVTIRSSLKMSHANSGTAWKLESLMGQLLAVSYIQWYDGRKPIVALPLADPQPTLKESIDTYFDALDYKVTPYHIDNIRGNSVATRLMSMVNIPTSPRPVPVVEVRRVLALDSNDPDVEGEINRITAILNNVPDCYPEQTPPTIDYKKDKRYVMITFECRGV